MSDASWCSTFCVFFCVRAILSWCPLTWHVYIVYNILSLNISSTYIALLLNAIDLPTLSLVDTPFIFRVIKQRSITTLFGKAELHIRRGVLWFTLRPCQIGILLSVNSSLTNLGSYSQKHTNRKRKHKYFYYRNNALFV